MSHMILGNTDQAGGQWADNPVDASWDIGTLSYADMLSLPGYSFAQHYASVYGKTLAPLTRPTRREVASYFAAYPSAVDIDDVIHCSEVLDGISRTPQGFYIKSHRLHCKHLVLASGIFSQLIPPRPLLQPLAALSQRRSGPTASPLLVIGSGFSAADIIISTPPEQKIIHIYKWDKNHPSPLKGCHQQAYPDYAGVYKRMKHAATAPSTNTSQRPRTRRESSTRFLERWDWEHNYEGLPNTWITDVQLEKDEAVVTMQRADGMTFQRRVGQLAYVVGRRGSLSYVDDELREELLNSDEATNSDTLISGQSLRQRALLDLEVSPDTFIIGSLTGDSLVRFAYGGCVDVAGRIIQRKEEAGTLTNGTTNSLFQQKGSPVRKAIPSMTPVMNGFAGHNEIARDTKENAVLDRRKECLPEELPEATMSCECLTEDATACSGDDEPVNPGLQLATLQTLEWQKSGWWAGIGLFIGTS